MSAATTTLDIFQLFISIFGFLAFFAFNVFPTNTRTWTGGAQPAAYTERGRKMWKPAGSLSIKVGLLHDSDMDGHLAEMVVLGSVSVSILRWLASIAAIYLLVLDRTNWRTNILTALLVPYIFLNLPSLIFNIFRGEVGRWIAFIAIVLRLFFPRHFPDWLELPGALILLLVAAPSLLANYLRSNVLGYIISLLIGVYLLQEHIRAAGGFRRAFSERHGISNTVGIILLFVSPLWELIKYFL